MWVHLEGWSQLNWCHLRGVVYLNFQFWGMVFWSKNFMIRSENLGENGLFGAWFPSNNLSFLWFFASLIFFLNSRNWWKICMLWMRLRVNLIHSSDTARTNLNKSICSLTQFWHLASWVPASLPLSFFKKYILVLNSYSDWQHHSTKCRIWLLAFYPVL